MKILVTLLRIAIGALFIFSGFIKAVDPLGFSYKLDEYFVVFEKYSWLKWMSADIFASNSLELGIFMCILEVFLGIALILGTYMRVTAVVSMLMMLYFTFLTGFSAITDSVKECGCFGDAIKLTPWESFNKDIVLTILLIPILLFVFKHKTSSAPVFKTVTWIGAIVSIAIPAYCLMYLPIIDFRPYKEGNNICTQMELPENAKLPVVEMVFKYKNKQTGVVEEFKTEELNGLNFDQYEFISREDKVIQEGDVAKIQDFDLFYEKDRSVKDFVLQNNGYKLFLVMYDLEHAKTEILEGFGQISAELKEIGVPTYGMYSINPANVLSEIQAQYELDFPFFLSDAIPLKTFIRSNPGLVLMQDCNVVKKWPARSFPSSKELKELVAQQELPDLDLWLMPEMNDLSGNSLKKALYKNGQNKVALIFGIEAMSDGVSEAVLDSVVAWSSFNKQTLLISPFPEEISEDIALKLESSGVLLIQMSEEDIQSAFNMDSGILLLDDKMKIEDSYSLF